MPETPYVNYTCPMCGGDRDKPKWNDLDDTVCGSGFHTPQSPEYLEQVRSLRADLDNLLGAEGTNLERAKARFPDAFTRVPEPQAVDYSEWMPTVSEGDPQGIMEIPLETIVYMAVGTATTCWSNLEGAGVFESDSCASISKRLTELMRLRGAE